MDSESLTYVVGAGDAAYSAALVRTERVRALGRDDIVAAERVYLQGETVLARLPELHGSTLTAVLAARGALPVGECVWLGVRVATALAQMHRAGLVHGDMGPDVVRVDGERLVVVDSLLASAGQTPVTSSAVPLGASSAEGSRAEQTPAGDVAALGRLLADMVRPADRVQLGAWLDPMTAGDPVARPTAAMVAHALVACAQEIPVQLPPEDVAGALRATAGVPERKAIARFLDSARAFVARTPREWVSPGGAPARPSRPEPGPRVRLAATVRGGRPSRLTVLAAAITAVSVGVLAVVAALGGSADGTTERTVADGGMTLAPDPVEAGQRLTVRRVQALADGDAARLLATVDPQSDASGRAEAQAEALEAGSLAFEGLSASVTDASLEAETEVAAAVRVTYRTSAHTVIVDGERADQEEREQVAVLELVLDHGRWRVAGATAG